MKIIDQQSLWIDYLENEVDPSLKEDLDRVLESSEEECVELGRLKVIRNLIRESRNVKMPEGEEYFDQLNSKIMAGIEKSGEPSRWTQWTQYINHLAAGLAVVLGIGIFLKFYGKSSSSTEVAGPIAGDYLEKITKENPKDFSKVMVSHLEETDIVLDAAAKKLDQYSEEELKLIMNQVLEEQRLMNETNKSNFEDNR